ncbi:hypothetical protein BGX33_008667 [Mortierella sp. NVP41]|nr:hypothetical protein BGX33_008667 [Mortierella sp. NVP41]
MDPAETTKTTEATARGDEFPVKITLLPNKGRSYVATRTIQPQELVFVAEPFGTTMCDPWLDCGICHYCWAEIRDRKAQIRLPSASSSLFANATTTRTSTNKKTKAKKEETVMVFCDETCLQMYGPHVADMICRVENKIRRTWADSEAKHWNIKKTGPHPKDINSVETADLASSSSSTVPATIHYSQLIEQALTTADTKQGVLELNDQDLAHFLDTIWRALDGLIAEQESWIQHAAVATDKAPSPFKGNHCQNDDNLTQQQQPRQQQQRHSHTQAQWEELYPKLARVLLEGNNQATIATKTSDDDCETIRLVSEILYRRQFDNDGASTTGGGAVNGAAEAQRRDSTKAPAAATLSKEDAVPSSGVRDGQRATYEDYCAMQSNELVLIRQQLEEDLDNQGDDEDDGDQGVAEEEDDDEENEEQASSTSLTQDTQDHHHYHHNSQDSKYDTDMMQWRKLLSILPDHLLSCFYVYLRLRDAYLLLALENTSLSSISTSTLASDVPPAQQTQPRPQPITLSIDSSLFRTILYREVANSFGIRDSSDELLGFAVFPLASFFNHSCRPNIQKKRRSGGRARQMEYWSTKVIQAGEECCISYGNISTGWEVRQARLEDMYFFRCSCPRCLEEEEQELEEQ